MKPQLHRSMGLTDVALFFIIASTNLQWVAGAAQAGPTSLFAWVAGCLALFVPLCIVVVYLSRKYPREGGMYVWATRAFGPYTGFITAWEYWVSTLFYFPGLLYFTAGAGLYLSAHRSPPPAYFLAVAVVGMAAGTALNVLGLESGKRFVNIAAWCRSAVIVLLVIFGAVWWTHNGFATPLTLHTLRPAFDLKEAVFLSVIALAYTGVESLPFMAEEVRDPHRAIPRGLALAAPAIVIIYVAGTVGLFAILPAAQVDSLYGVVQGFASVASHFGGPLLLDVLVVLVLVSCLGSLTAWIGANARLPFVAGIDDYLPAAFARLHPRYKSPVVSLYVQCAVALVLVVLSQSGTNVKGAYDILVSSTVLGTMVPFVLMFASAIKLAGDNIVARVAGCLGVCTSIIAMVLSAFPAENDPNPAIAVAKIVGFNLLMLLAGTAFFFIRARQLARRALARQASGA